MSQFANIAEDGGLGENFNSSDYAEDGIGLALSGGGYKAAAYHLGALIRLEELGLLPKIERVSSVSGGSIAAAFLGLKWNDLAFDPASGRSPSFKQEFVVPLRHFLTNVNIDVPQILLGLLAPFRSGGDGLAQAYAEHLYGNATLQDLPKAGQGPRFTIVATNYELNSLWRFSQPYAADFRVGMIDLPRFPLSQVVAASSGFPPFFCPITLDFGGQRPAATLGADRATGRYLERASLCDGGIYDNMGLEPIWKRLGVLLVSNAGDAIDEFDTPSDWAHLLLRVLGMIHRQAENNRQRMLMLLAATGARKVAYWPLRNDGSNYPHPGPVQAPEDIAGAQKEKVRLWSLGDVAFARLANHGYSLCAAATQSYLSPVVGAPAPVLPF